MASCVCWGGGRRGVGKHGKRNMDQSDIRAGCKTSSDHSRGSFVNHVPIGIDLIPKVLANMDCLLSGPNLWCVLCVLGGERRCVGKHGKRNMASGLSVEHRQR